MPGTDIAGKPVAAFVHRHDVLRMLLEWIADRITQPDDTDTSIDWEDGEAHDEPAGPTTVLMLAANGL